MRVIPIACLSDNYAYLVVSGKDAVVVDASEAAPVKRAAEREGLRLRAIWSTHHHLDHVGGNVELAAELRIPVVGHKSDEGRLPGLTQGVDTGDVVRAGVLAARCLHIPGHTRGAVGYFVEDGGERAVFTGDTLFCAGCGRLFEGTPSQMYASLGSLISLPGDTRVYCGHEYTESNLRFAAHVEPENMDIARALARAEGQRAKGEPTIGTTLEDERRTNPFLRTDSIAIRANLGIAADADGATAFGVIRAAKDSFT